MTLGLCFWVIVIVAVVFFGALFGGLIGSSFGGFSWLILLVLVLLLGWQEVFGPPLHT